MSCDHYTARQLAQRGWTRRAIRRLGRPCCRVPNPHSDHARYPLGFIAMRCWPTAHVHTIEAQHSQQPAML